MWTSGSKTQQRGRFYESLAWQHLKKAGLKLVARNFRIPGGEIDLICRDGETLVFVEVRYRACIDYGTSAATVTRTKQQKLRRAAYHYLQKNGLYEKIPCRFDVVGVTHQQDMHCSFDWIKNAFA